MPPLARLDIAISRASTSTFDSDAPYSIRPPAYASVSSVTDSPTYASPARSLDERASTSRSASSASSPTSWEILDTTRTSPIDRPGPSSSTGTSLDVTMPSGTLERYSECLSLFPINILFSWRGLCHSLLPLIHGRQSNYFSTPSVQKRPLFRMCPRHIGSSASHDSRYQALSMQNWKNQQSLRQQLIYSSIRTDTNRRRCSCPYPRYRRPWLGARSSIGSRNQVADIRRHLPEDV